MRLVILRSMRWAALAIVLLTMACSGSPTAPGGSSFTAWSQAGSGDTVVVIPSSVSKARVVADFPGNSSNFILNCPGTPLSPLFVNELMGTYWGRTHFDGTYLTGGCRQVQISQSSGVSWSLTAVP